LLPILAELDVALNEPMVATVHNMIKGWARIGCSVALGTVCVSRSGGK
jgi:hypothetical protein